MVIFGEVHNLLRMLKRIFPIALLTGSGQLFSLFALKYVSRLGSSLDLKAIGQTDSLVIFMLNGIAMGLQTATMRDLALASDWKQDYHNTQSARLTLSLFLSAGALLAFFNSYYLLFLFAPVLAMNGDYALYARSHPVIGAVIGFSRLFIPYGAVAIAASLYPEWIVPSYILTTVLVYFVSNLCISAFLKTPVLEKPSLRNLHLYIKSLPLGVVVLSLYFIGLGLMIIIPYFYSNPIIAVAYVGLKFYVIFKGVLRIVHQAFIREMSSYQVCLQVDQMGMLAGLVFASLMICYPVTFISIFFGAYYIGHPSYFILLTIAGLIYSSFSSFITRAMLEKRDHPSAVAASSCALFTIILVIVLSFFFQNAISIGISLVIGEALYAISLIIILKHEGLVWERMRFFLQNIYIILIPGLFVFFFCDQLKYLLISVCITLPVIAILHFKKFAFGVGMA
jgi:hypothetical protein